MSGVVFVEEPSAQIVCEALAERLGLTDQITIISHDGKADLGRSFPPKIRAWRYPQDARFLVSRDNDGSDCKELKERLLQAVPEERRRRTKVRLVMQELEAWYLGDISALRESGLVMRDATLRRARKRAERGCDAVTRPSEFLYKLTGGRGKIGMARAIGPHLDPNTNSSASLKHFCNALVWSACGTDREDNTVSPTQ